MELDDRSPEEHYRSDHESLLRLCAYLSGSIQAAEDLAQEALIEAWRHEHTLRDPSRRAAWLSGIARNVCLRWRRAQGMDQTVPGSALTTGEGEDVFTGVAGDADVECDLEHDELALLLDRAMALLPARTRDILIARFIDDLTHSEIAQRLKLNEATVKVRIHRGKITLRRVLTTQFAADLGAYGFVAPNEGWQETRIWCSSCGASRLLMRLSDASDRIKFRCPGCSPDSRVTTTEYPLTNPHLDALIGKLRRPATILGLGAAWCAAYLRQAPPDTVVPCSRCGRSVAIRRFERVDTGDRAWTGDGDGLCASCENCGEEISCSRRGLVAALPEVQNFRRETSGVRLLPSIMVEAEGREVAVTRVESRAGAAGFDVLTDAGTYEVIAVEPPATR